MIIPGVENTHKGIALYKSGVGKNRMLFKYDKSFKTCSPQCPLHRCLTC